MATRKAASAHANRLLGLLTPRDYQRLRPHLRRLTLKYRQSLYAARKPIGFVYFIETGVGSLVNTMENGQAAEVGTIGNEGMVGLPLLLGDDRAPTSVYVHLAMMLGVQRTGVSVAAGALQRAGLIHYRRGIVTIHDRAGLQRCACECYGVSKREFDRLLGVQARRRSARPERSVRTP